MAKKSTTKISKTSQVKSTTKIQEAVQPKSSTKVQEAVQPEPPAKIPTADPPKSETKTQDAVKPQSSTKVQKAVQPEPPAKIPTAVPPKSETKTQDAVKPQSPIKVQEAVQPKIETKPQEAVPPGSPTKPHDTSPAESSTKVQEIPRAKNTAQMWAAGDLISVPSSLLAGVFDKISYRRCNQEVEVNIQFLVPPADEWNTAVAIDCSESMRSLFGKALTGDIPLVVQERYHRQNLVFEEEREGRLLRFYKPEAYEDAISNGYLNWTKNEVEPEARKLLEYFATQIDSRKSSNLIYWGCEKGVGWVDLGEISGGNWNSVEISGPEASAFGCESKLLPLVQNLVTKFLDVPKTQIVILTDGRFSDFEEVRNYCATLALLIKAKERNFMRFTIIGMGKEIKKNSFSELEGMKISSTADLWNYMNLDAIKEFGDIFRGMLSEDEIAAPKALILDASGKTVKTFETGLPATTSFMMPISSSSFSIQFPPGNKKIEQSLLRPFHKTLF